MVKFLIADDSTLMRTFLKNILTGYGYKVVGEAKNGKIAVEKYKELTPDVVTLDLNMDEMDGLEALKEIKEYDSNAKVIMISAMGQKSIIQEALQSGAKGFVTKPFDGELVLSTVKTI